MQVNVTFLIKNNADSNNHKQTKILQHVHCKTRGRGRILCFAVIGEY